MNDLSLPKHRQRGEATRAAILAAARERFAADGYERTTIRAIALDAGADPSLVMRYYGNKEQLFALAAEVDLRMPDFARVPRARMGAALVEHFLNRWEDDEALQVLLRAAATKPEAAATLRKVFAGQITPKIAKMAGDVDEKTLRAGLVASQMMGLALCRYVLKLPPMVRLAREDIIRTIGPTIQRYLCGKLDG
jgi:AcrR family transcriptional regulator